MRIFLPGDANRVAMTKQAFIAVYVFGDRFTHVVAAPGSGIDNRLFSLWLLPGDSDCETCKKPCDCKKLKCMSPAKAQRRKEKP
jgi:hypothetical protein